METVMSCRSLAKNYSSSQALCAITLDIYKGRIVGLYGRSGSGRTTLMKLAAGLLSPSSGEILISDMPIGKKTKKIVSYLPDCCCLPENMTVSEAIQFFRDFYTDFDPSKAFDMLDRMGVSVGGTIGGMSFSCRRKVQFALAMSRRAKLYLLDDPFLGTDPSVHGYIADSILSAKDPESTVIISSDNIIETEPLLDDVLWLQCGTVRLYDSAEDLKSRTGKSLDEYFREVYRC